MAKKDSTRVEAQDIQKVEDLFGPQAFKRLPRTPCSLRRLLRSLQPEIVTNLRKIDILRNPELYFCSRNADEISRLKTPLEKQEYCEENGLCNDLTSKNLAKDFDKGISRLDKTRTPQSNLLPPGLFGYMVSWLEVRKRQNKGVLRQIRTLSHYDLEAYLI